MTTITIKTGSNAGVREGLRAIPMGLTTETGFYVDDTLGLGVHIKAKRKEHAFNAATAFISAFPGEFLGATEKTGKKITELAF